MDTGNKKVYEAKDLTFKVHEGKACACILDMGFRILKSGDQIKFQTQFHWNKYLDLYNNARVALNGYKRDQINEACFAMCCEEFPWGMKLKKHKLTAKLVGGVEAMVADFVVEVP